MKTSEKIIIVVMLCIILVEIGVSQQFSKSEEVSQVKSYEMNAKAIPEFDTPNLRFAAEYEVEVAAGVSWVPANVLGKSSLTNAEIEEMLYYTPEEKQVKISNLYEAIQLYQVGDFSFLEDTNKQYYEDEVLWEYHIPGEEAVRINGGNCSTSAAWLNYILKGDYEESGYIAFSQSNGNGHVWNYLFDGECYYFIDMTHYRLDFISFSAIETGDMEAYCRSDRIGGNILKTKSIEAYVDYCMSLWNDPPEMMFAYNGDVVTEIGVQFSDDTTVIYYPKGMEITVLYDRLDDHVEVQYVDFPNHIVDWSCIPNSAFISQLPFN